jgi:hypothetical protein
MTMPSYDVLLYINNGGIDAKIDDAISSMRMRSIGSFSLDHRNPRENTFKIWWLHLYPPFSLLSQWCGPPEPLASTFRRTDPALAIPPWTPRRWFKQVNFTNYNLQLTIFSLHFAVCSLQFALYIFHFPFYNLQFTVYSLQFTVHSSYFTNHSSQFTVHSSQFTVYSSQFTVHSSQFTVYSLLFTVYCLQFTVYSLQFTVYSLHFTVYS